MIALLIAVSYRYYGQGRRYRREGVLSPDLELLESCHRERHGCFLKLPVVFVKTCKTLTQGCIPVFRKCDVVVARKV